MPAITRVARRWRGSPRFLSPRSVAGPRHVAVGRSVTGCNDAPCFTCIHGVWPRREDLLCCFPVSRSVCGSACRWCVNDSMPQPADGGLCAVQVTNLGELASLYYYQNLRMLLRTKIHTPSVSKLLS
ncbi:hypothetical protein D1007_03113 [Hordeum vulgare]|nr:hypothetical protein D1007_03113 [Hordeum vulgare]